VSCEAVPERSHLTSLSVSALGVYLNVCPLSLAVRHPALHLPPMCTPTTTSTSATPGAVATQGALRSVSRPDAIMCPTTGPAAASRGEEGETGLEHDGVADASAAATITRVRALGRMWRPRSGRRRPRAAATLDEGPGGERSHLGLPVARCIQRG